MINGLKCEALSLIPGEKGSVIKLIQKDKNSFPRFGEAYLSTIKQNEIKGWKKHTKMTCNLVVVTGEIEFIIHDFKDEDQTIIESNNFLLNQDDYKKLTIPPCLWFAFKGIAKKNIVLNITDMMHDDAEVLGQEVDYDIFPSLRL